MTVDPATADGSFLSNVASISTSTSDPDPLNDSDFELTTVSREADVGVVKVDSVDPVVAGTSFAYTVTVSNAGPSDSVGVVLTDVLPAGVSFVSAVPDQGSCSEVALTGTCPLGTITDGASVDVVITVGVPSDAAAGTITNNASVVATTTDPVAANDSAAEDTDIVVEADVGVVKVDSVDPVVAGTSFAYTVTVSNAGPSDSVGVVLTDVLPAGVSFVSAVPDQGSCSEVALTVTCPLGTITDGASVDVVITVTVGIGVPAGTVLTNNASITSASTDPNATNDADSEDTTVTVIADLSVTKVDAFDPVIAGTDVTYTVTVVNGGPSTAPSVVMTDTLPANVTYVSATPTQGTCSESAGTVTCPIGTMTSGSSVDVVIVATVDADVPDGSTLTNNASVSSAATDPTPADNMTSENTTIVTSADVSVVKVDAVDPVAAGIRLLIR